MNMIPGPFDQRRRQLRHVREAECNLDQLR